MQTIVIAGLFAAQDARYVLKHMEELNASGERVEWKKRFKGPTQTSVQSLFERQPPQSLEAEMSLLGSMLLEPSVIPDVLGFLKGPDDFFKEAHREIYRTIVELYDTRQTGDLVQILDRLRDRGLAALAGDGQYLVELANSVPGPANAPHFARLVGEKAKLRRLIDAAGQILYDAYHAGELGPDGAREVLDKAESSVFDIAQEQSTTDPQSLAELLNTEMQRIENMEFTGSQLTGLSSGYRDLDEMTRGFQPGELIIIAARPSMGKTSLAMNIAEQIARGGVAYPGPKTSEFPIAVFSLEMSKNAIVQRLLSARSGVSGQLLRGGSRLSREQFRSLMIAAEELKADPLYVDDTPSLTVLSLRARARRMVQRYGVRMVMIDYLQLMTAPGAARESRQVEVSAISRGVKALARELNIPVVCLSQLNRASESREGNRPRMSDLRESGSIEQDADVIILLHREDYYHIQDEDWKIENADKIGVAELIVAKQRNGPTGVVKLVWDSNTTRFKNFDPHAAPPPDYGGPGKGVPAPQPKPKTGGGAAPWTQQAGPPGDSGSAPFAPTQAPAPGGAFGGRSKTGPIHGHRDGGGPDADLGDIPT
ncbi:MAG: replicative DNA helicase [Phycisphaerales bacterium]